MKTKTEEALLLIKDYDVAVLIFDYSIFIDFIISSEALSGKAMKFFKYILYAVTAKLLSISTFLMKFLYNYLFLPVYEMVCLKNKINTGVFLFIFYNSWFREQEYYQENKVFSALICTGLFTSAEVCSVKIIYNLSRVSRSISTYKWRAFFHDLCPRPHSESLFWMIKRCAERRLILKNESFFDWSLSFVDWTCVAWVGKSCRRIFFKSLQLNINLMYCFWVISRVIFFFLFSFVWEEVKERKMSTSAD